jgi:peptidoglycan/xylan/chitin deacetylase (PgdA/CDA1 family)
MKSRFSAFLLIFFIPFYFLSAFEFNNITLSSDDKFLYRTDFESQYSLFFTDLTDMSTQQLTAFPEKLYLADNGRTIIVLNKFGAASIPLTGGLPSPVKGYPSFANGSVPLRGNLQDLAASADGRWIIHLEPTSPGFGSLFLFNAISGDKRLISEKVELPNADFPAKWSPDSRLFVYAKSGKLFYFPILNNLSTLIDERFRMIGPGGIDSVTWGQKGDFYFFTGNTLYRVINPELFTRTIYGDFLSIGAVAAVLPLQFDSGFDQFWIAPDSGAILINKNGKGLFFFLLGENRYNAAVLPNVIIPYGAENFNVLWSAAGQVTVLYSLKGDTSVLRFGVSGNSISALTQRTSPSLTNGSLSPDGTRAIFWGENGLELWDYENWRHIQRLGFNPVFSCVWLSNRSFITGNSRFIEEINITSSSYPRRRICLSGAEDFGFEEGSASRILVKTGTDWFATDGKSAWVSAGDAQLRQVSYSSSRYRVFLEPQTIGEFKNIPMIRSMSATGTQSLVSKHTVNSAFTLGRQIPIALCFDLYDDDSGLTQVLSALKRRNIRATFFLNGDFIRKNPQASLAITEDGHETGSLFYSPIDLSDTRYRITQDFIARGLARNEDEFNKATGKELSILWHPPFYRSSNQVNSAAAASGYITVSRSMDLGDYLSRAEALRLNLRQIPSAEMIDQIIKKREANAIIPLRLGQLPGGRDDYMFQRIEVLLDALLRCGYVIVPVSSIIR